MRFFSRGRGGVTAKIALSLALLLLLLGGSMVFVYRNAELRAWIFEKRLNSLPNADYSALVSELYAQERFDEAAVLAAFAERYADMPGQQEIAALQGRIYAAIREKRSPLARGAAFLGGVLTGSARASTGGLIANLLTGLTGIGVMPEGDVSPQTRNASERLAVALEGAHLGIAGRWFPAAMRTLRRADLVTPEYERFLLGNARDSAARSDATPELQSAVASTRTLATEVGLPLALAMHRAVRNDEDLAQLAMWSRLSPDETYIVAARGGIGLLSLLPDTAEGRKTLTAIAKKGERGVRSALFWLVGQE